MVCVPIPIAVGVYVTEQLAAFDVGLPRAQLAGEDVPVPLDVKVTVPVGALRLPVSSSVTVAVQLVPAFTGTLLGAQITVVVVWRLLTVMLAVAMLLSKPSFTLNVNESAPVYPVVGV